MGVGVNITCANHVFFLDHDFSRPMEQQAMGRIRRPYAQTCHQWTAYYMLPDDKDCMHWMRSLQQDKHCTGSELMTGHTANLSNLVSLGAARPSQT